MGLFRKLNKDSIVKGAISVLEAAQRGETLAEKMEMRFKTEAMKDEDVAFVIKSFRSKYGLHGVDMYAKPVVEEGTMLIKNWEFIVNREVLFIEAGLDELITKISASIMSNDEITVDEVIRRLRVCVAE